jgi:hypothetical protein
MNIPASNIVNVIPSVLAAGGNVPVLSGVFLSQNNLVPTNQVLVFTTPAAVGQYFGQGSDEYLLANNVYFNGFNNSFSKPGALLIAPYNETARAAFLQSGFLTGVSLADLQALPAGTFTVVVDGVSHTSASIDLSTSTSFSDAAADIATAINSPGTYVSVTWNAINETFVISSLTTGATSTMTYAVDGVGSTLAASLKLTNNTGAVLSQGAVVDTPSTAINNLINNNIAWCTIATLWEPDQDNKLLFAAAINDLQNKYVYSCWDTDPEEIIANSVLATSYLINQAGYNGTVVISGDEANIIAEGSTIAAVTRNLAVFVQGFIASIDFTQTNGRATAAFKSLSGLLPSVTSATSAANLLSNGCNFYGAYANATNDWVFFYPGNISGIYKWIDSYVNQVYMNAQFQTALMELLLNNNSLPYNTAGYSAIKVALSQSIQQAINFGTIRTGITLSPEQIAITNSQAGLNISDSLFSNGYYLQVLDPGATARQNRQTPIINFWYTDGQSIQQIVMESIDIL